MEKYTVQIINSIETAEEAKMVFVARLVGQRFLNKKYSINNRKNFNPNQVEFGKEFSMFYFQSGKHCLINNNLLTVGGSVNGCR